MRKLVTVFLLGATLGMWADALLVEFNSDTLIEWVVGKPVVNLIEEVDTTVDGDGTPGRDWLNENKPREIEV